jgi:hypothetical protein
VRWRGAFSRRRRACQRSGPSAWGSGSGPEPESGDLSVQQSSRWRGPLVQRAPLVLSSPVPGPVTGHSSGI